MGVTVGGGVVSGTVVPLKTSGATVGRGASVTRDVGGGAAGATVGGGVDWGVDVPPSSGIVPVLPKSCKTIRHFPRITRLNNPPKVKSKVKSLSTSIELELPMAMHVCRHSFVMTVPKVKAVVSLSWCCQSSVRYIATISKL